MRTATLIALLVASCSSAQVSEEPSKLQTLAAQIESYTATLPALMAVDLRLRAAERIQAIDPATAQRLMDGALPRFAQLKPPQFITLRFMITYAAIDLDARREGGLTASG